MPDGRSFMNRVLRRQPAQEPVDVDEPEYRPNGADGGYGRKDVYPRFAEPSVNDELRDAAARGVDEANAHHLSPALAPGQRPTQHGGGQ